MHLSVHSKIQSFTNAKHYHNVLLATTKGRSPQLATQKEINVQVFAYCMISGYNY